jgi:PEGA domain
MDRYATILVGVLLVSVGWSHAATRPVEVLTIKVMGATTESIPLSSDNNGVPKNCGIIDYDAYCHHSRSAIVRHTLLVQDSSGKSLTISCTVDSIWSKCIALPVGQTFSAEHTKRGITVWYPNAKGREVKQAYVLVSNADKAAVTLSSPESSPVANLANSSGMSRDTVKCNFTSTPAGAEITLDGKYVGNTPSGIAVGPGPHSVELTMPGFASWKRELTVTSGSDVNVNATLQKH